MNKEKRKILIVVLVIIIISAIVGIVSIIIINNKEPEEQQYENDAENILDYSDSEVDMENLENAEIIDALKINISEKVKEEKIFNDKKIITAQISASKNRANFIADVKNELEKEVEDQIIIVTFMRQDGSEIAKEEAIFPALESGGEGQVVISTNKDIANAYDYKIESKE